ncbi:MAG: SUMF1/EgtB/PvdO family nonheme iron enzyme [Acidobacteria bacterium]|nr:SUMF1/EgtB/PvdO family nonheme iron enzyme [Acidobacteriota bacterium]
MSSRQHIQERLAAAVSDRYEVLEWIGGGGMAGVYLARHRLHGGFCAIKVLAEHLADDENLVASFMQEARTAASLEGHPHIVRTIDIAANNGLYYLIMNYIEGEDMSSYLDRHGRLTPLETATVIYQVADALAWAHERGVVHRDLKPANIRLDKRGHVVVMDFGIAKVGATPSALTQMGATVGTPYYMSPEQIDGLPVDARSDLYALGVIAYQLVTGRRPFDGENHHAIWNAHRTVTPPPPEELAPDIPAPLSYVIQKLLQKDPAQRYQSAAEVADHLQRIVKSGDAVTLTPQIGKQIDHWRATPTSGVTFQQTGSSSSSTPLVEDRTVAIPPPGRFDEPPARETPVQPPPPVQPEPPKKKGLLAVALGGLIIVLIGLIGAVVWWIPKSATPDPPPNVNVDLPVEIETPTGTMVLVPGGEAVLGDDVAESAKDWNQRRTIDLGPFYIDETEVSNAAYKAFHDATGHALPQPPKDDPDYFESKPNYPVVNITYEDAVAFAAWAGKRLPTNEEWEKAARGIDGRIYPWGDAPPGPQHANVAGDADGFPNLAPVDALPLSVSPFGALHLAGNVWELTASEFRPQNFHLFLEDMRLSYPNASQSWHSIRGGSYLSPGDDSDLRPYSRAGWPDNLADEFIGFRCAKDPE